MAQLIGSLLIYVQDYDYYDRYDDSRELFDRRYSGMGGNSGMRGIFLNLAGFISLFLMPIFY